MSLNFNSDSSQGEYELRDSMDSSDFVLILFQRDYYCTNCRTQVQKVEDRYQEFKELDCQVVSVLPENLSRAENWSQKYELEFPVVADEDTEISDSFDQPVRFGPLGSLNDIIGRMPLTILIDARADDPEVVYREAGSGPADRPSVDEILDEIKKNLEQS